MTNTVWYQKKYIFQNFPRGGSQSRRGCWAPSCPPLAPPLISTRFPIHHSIEIQLLLFFPDEHVPDQVKLFMEHFSDFKNRFIRLQLMTITEAEYDSDRFTNLDTELALYRRKTILMFNIYIITVDMFFDLLFINIL